VLVGAGSLWPVCPLLQVFGTEYKNNHIGLICSKVISVFQSGTSRQIAYVVLSKGKTCSVGQACTP